MTDGTMDPSAGAAAPAPNARLNVLGQYVRKLAFENIAAARGDAATSKPSINVQVRVDSQKVADERHQVVLATDCRAVTGEAEVFRLDLEYVGVFELANIPETALQPLLSIECPRLLFPFARRVIAETSRDGGFPPLMLDPIDFRALYLRQAQQAAAARQPNGDGSATPV